MQDKTQITMIVIWVTELFMYRMGALRSSNTSYLHDSQYMELQKQFDSFLAIPKVEVFYKSEARYFRKMFCFFMTFYNKIIQNKIIQNKN